MADSVSIDLVRVTATLDSGSTPALLAESVSNLCCAALAIFEAEHDSLSEVGWGALYLLRQTHALASELHGQLERAAPQ